MHFVNLLSLALKSLALRRNGRRGECWLVDDKEQLHRLWKRLSEEGEERLPALAELHFHEAGAFPYSQELSESLDLLQQAGVIVRENPSFKRFRPTWHEGSREAIERMVEEAFQGAEERQAFDHLVAELEALVDTGQQYTR